ncbi:MAG: hypothetical protein JOS17DRAFT_616063 [Linnemannia elongata]|nr:MAG: hypothetical protein JOS17DRAFT_616063 [Linnemannia elongata]
MRLRLASLSFLLILLARPSVFILFACQCLSFIVTFNPLMSLHIIKALGTRTVKHPAAPSRSWSSSSPGRSYLSHIPNFRRTPALSIIGPSSLSLFFFIAFFRLPSVFLFPQPATCSSFITVCSHTIH